MKPNSEEFFSPEAYGAAFAALLSEPRLAPLGPGKPHERMRATLESLTLAGAFAPHPIADLNMARGCLAGVWLYHDFLDESHSISQEIHTPTGSYWHALMHRREPDFDNSKYWWRRVGDHPVFALLAEEAARLGWRMWEPAAFVDACEQECGSGSDREMLLRKVQRAEWGLLFDWCYRQAKR
jgi:hypothetical protein